MKKQTLIVLGGLMLIAAALTACGLTGSNADPLNGTAWVLSTYGFAIPIPGSTVSVSFEDGAVHGSGGCNSFGGSYEVRGDKLTFTDVAITEMACMEPDGVMEQEQEIMRFFWEAESFSIEDGQLRIIRADGEPMVLNPQ